MNFGLETLFFIIIIFLSCFGWQFASGLFSLEVALTVCASWFCSGLGNQEGYMN